MKHKHVLLKVLIVTFLVVFNMNVFGYIYHNGSSSGYTNDEDNPERDAGTIEVYIIDGADYYFSAHSDIISMLKMYELQDRNGIDYEMFNRALDSAVANMENAAATYENLIRTVEVTPYNEEVIDRLLSFDYYTFMKENGLNRVIGEKVESYLKKGDITGIYKETYSTFLYILKLLNVLKEEISPGKPPELSIMWELNDVCSKSSLFGSYVSRVFYAVL